MKKEMTKQEFWKICRGLEVFLRISQVFLLISVVMGIFNAVRYCIAPHDGFTVAEVMWDLLVAWNGAVCGIAVTHGANAFRSMRKSDSPFLWDVSDKIKAASQTLILGGAIGSVVEIVLAVLGNSLFSAGPYMMSEGPDMIGILIMGVLLYALVHVLEQGCRLQQESDETL